MRDARCEEIPTTTRFKSNRNKTHIESMALEFSFCCFKACELDEKSQECNGLVALSQYHESTTDMIRVKLNLELFLSSKLQS